MPKDLKYILLYFPKPHTDIIRNVALIGTLDRSHRGMLRSRIFFNFRRKGEDCARKGILVCSPEK